MCLFSCQKELTGTSVISNETLPDLNTKIQSSVSGFVTDENESSIEGAAVQYGSGSATTDKFGYFRIDNSTVLMNAAFVAITKPGYFKTGRTFFAHAGKTVFSRIKGLPKITVGNFQGSTGGSVTLNNGFTLNVPDNGVVNAANNEVYKGKVTVALQWLNPFANDFNRLMPGDLRGLTILGGLKKLSPFGIAVIEINGSSGEKLQIAKGKKATLYFPIPNAFTTAPSSVPLWYFDETLGLWKEEGTAARNGNNFIGEVSHFSYWNCAIPMESVEFNCTIENDAGKAIQNALVKISVPGNQQNTQFGYTDISGFVSGAIAAGSQILLEVFNDNNCQNPVFSRNLNISNTGALLDNIKMPAANSSTLIGMPTNCNNGPVTNGFVIIKKENFNYRAELNSGGSFNINTIICSGNNNSVQLNIVDNTTPIQGNSIFYTLQSGFNIVPELNTCGNITEQYINYSYNGTSYSITPPEDSMIQYFLPATSTPAIQIYGYSNRGTNFTSANIYVSQPGIGLNKTQELLSITLTGLIDSGNAGNIIRPIPVKITEYGPIGGFISGNFIGKVTGIPPENTPINLSCRFRVRRNT